MTLNSILLTLAIVAACCASAIALFFILKRRREAALLERMAETCWKGYVELETLRQFNETCRRCITGETGLLGACRQLGSVLDSATLDDGGKAVRIADQVGAHVANLVTASKMASADGTKLQLPQKSPALMSRESYLNSLNVEPSEQLSKYGAVDATLRRNIRSSKDDRRWPDMLRRLLKAFEPLYRLAESENRPDPASVVALGTKVYKESTEIFKDYEINT